VIYILDILGVFAFSFLGACTALEGRLNVIGVLTCAFLSALGGGTIREVILNRVPFYFHDRWYLLTVLLASMMAWILRERLPPLRNVMPVLDAIGLVVFAYIGAHAAAHAHLGLSGMLLFALLTAIGGGILSDLVAHRTPQVFQNAIYAAPPILVAVLYWYLADLRDQPVTVRCSSYPRLQYGCSAFMAYQQQPVHAYMPPSRDWCDIGLCSRDRGSSNDIGPPLTVNAIETAHQAPAQLSVRTVLHHRCR
jgi:uncharacterized membrane protein YeiH